jgi:hypothetical protein
MGGDPGDGGNDLPDPPPMACDGGGATGGCPSPPLACMDAAVAVAYQGQCQAGRCAWSKEPYDCPNGCLAGIPQGAVVDGGIPIDGGRWVTFNACLYAVPLAPVPPATPCSMSASASDVCPPPPSVCVKTELNNDLLVYYDDGQCVAGSCAWDTRYVPCPGGCWAGACETLPTPAP